MNIYGDNFPYTVLTNTIDYRSVSVDMVEQGQISAEDMMTMALNYMSQDDVHDMLKDNELDLWLEE